MVNLINDECINAMQKIDDNSIDMILCDLPYGITSCKWDVVIPFEELWKQYNRIIKPSGVIALFAIEPFASALRFSNIKNYKYEWYWDKVRGGGILNAKKRPLKRIENIIIFSNGVPCYFPIMEVRSKPRQKGSYNKDIGRELLYNDMKFKSNINNVYYPCNLLTFSNAVNKGKLHPTQKPVSLLEYLIKTYTLEGETVLDNCMGSGSTGVACVNTNRDFIGIELDGHYYNVAKERIKEAGVIM